MGFWRHGDDVLGDRPADILGNLLVTVAEMRRDDGEAAPTWESLFATVVSVIAEDAGVYLGEVGPVGLPNVALHFAGGGRVEPSPAARDEALAPALRYAFAKVARAYEAEVGRGPRMSELLGTVRFVVAPDPEAYLDDGRRLDRIEFIPR